MNLLENYHRHGHHNFVAATFSRAMTRQEYYKVYGVSKTGENISFKPSDVPEYLRKTEFFSSLEEDGGQITLPNQFFKSNLSVSSSQDVHHLLSTMRFWGVEEIPSQLIKYVAKSSHQDLSEILSNFTKEIKVTEFLYLLNIEVHHIRPSTHNRPVNWRTLARVWYL